MLETFYYKESQRIIPHSTDKKEYKKKKMFTTYNQNNRKIPRFAYRVMSFLTCGYHLPHNLFWAVGFGQFHFELCLLVEARKVNKSNLRSNPKILDSHASLLLFINP